MNKVSNQQPAAGSQRKCGFLDFAGSWLPGARSCRGATTRRGMTLIETLVAISILSVAIVAPMSLTMQSLSAAYYARDQITAFNLAQEAIESVRSVRDGNILSIALNASPTCASDGLSMHLLCGIPIDRDFMIDTRDNHITPCDQDGTSACDSLQTDGDLYGYEAGWTDTLFTRTVRVTYVGVGNDEINIKVTVERPAGLHQAPPFILHENLYRWVEDGSGA